MPQQETNQNQGMQKSPSKRGFAAMNPEQQRAIASKGGKAAHEKGTAHEFTPEEARIAGRKGGEVVSRDRKHMSQIGAEGGRARGRNARKNISNESTPSSPQQQPQQPVLNDNERRTA